MSRTSLALALVVAAIPAIAGAQQDSTRRNTDRTTQSRAGDIDRGNGTNRGNGGNRRFRGRNYGLDREQVRQLQEAIDDKTECDVGTADGMMGPKTRRALTCARRELGVQGNDMGELFTALGLDFSSDDSGNDAQSDDSRSNAGNRRDAGERRSSGSRSNARGNSGDRARSGRDSTMRDSSRGQPPVQRPR